MWELRLPLSDAVVSKAWRRLLRDGVVTVGGMCRWVVRACVAKEHGWPEPRVEQDEKPRRRSKNSKKKRAQSTQEQKQPAVYQSSRSVGIRGSGGVALVDVSVEQQAPPPPTPAPVAVAPARRRESRGGSRDSGGGGGGSGGGGSSSSSSSSGESYSRVGGFSVVGSETGAEPAGVWPGTVVDLGVPPLPSRVAPLLGAPRRRYM